MPILFNIRAISGSYPDIAINDNKSIFMSTGIFYPSGKLILLHLLCCDPFAVLKHSFMSRRLTSAATAACE
jgi:hypothetical protein